MTGSYSLYDSIGAPQLCISARVGVEEGQLQDTEESPVSLAVRLGGFLQPPVLSHTMKTIVQREAFP